MPKLSIGGDKEFSQDQNTATWQFKASGRDGDKQVTDACSGHLEEVK